MANSNEEQATDSFNEVDGRSGAASGSYTSLNHLNVGMENLYASRAQADITVCIGDKHIRCHKAVLMAASPYFEAMFNSGMKEAIDGEIRFQDMSASIFEHVLEFIYTGKHIVTKDNATSLLEAASLLQINALFQLCEETISCNLSLENCLEAWRFASLHNAKKVLDAAFQLILRQFQDFVNQDDFHKLTYSELLRILQDDRLEAPLEESVIEAVMDWGQSSEERKHDVGNLIAESRLCQLSLDHLFKLKRYFSTNRDCATARISIDDAIEYKLIPAKRQATSSIFAKYRNCNSLEEVMALIANDELFVFSFLRNKWFKLSNLPRDPGGEMATCSTGTSLFVTGGCYSCYTFIEYKATQNKWKERSELSRGRYSHAMIATSDALFVLGGYEDTEDGLDRLLSSVEKYTFAVKKWETCGELAQPSADIAAVVVDYRIYVFGGWVEQERQSDSTEKGLSAMIQCYDISTDACTCTPLPGFPIVLKAIQCNETIYLFCCQGKVGKFEISTETFEQIHKTVKFWGQEYEIVQRDGMVHIVFYNEKVILNLETGEESVESIISPFGADHSSSAKIVIDKKYLTEESQLSIGNMS